MRAIALIAVVLALTQNLAMFAFGLKESAIFSAPLSFVGIFIAEFVAIGLGYVGIRRFLHGRQVLALTAWVLGILALAECTLPVSSFAIFAQQIKRQHVLNRIELAKSTIEPLDSGPGGRRFALTYTLKFPRTGRYLTFPAYLGPPDKRVFGEYVKKAHPEYYRDDAVFDAGRLYDFTVVFDTAGMRFDLARETANIDICDGKDYFMACRTIAIRLAGAPATRGDQPSPGPHNPE